MCTHSSTARVLLGASVHSALHEFPLLCPGTFVLSSMPDSEIRQVGPCVHQWSSTERSPNVARYSFTARRRHRSTLPRDIARFIFPDLSLCPRDSKGTTTTMPGLHSKQTHPKEKNALRRTHIPTYRANSLFLLTNKCNGTFYLSLEKTQRRSRLQNSEINHVII